METNQQAYERLSRAIDEATKAAYKSTKKRIKGRNWVISTDAKFRLNNEGRQQCAIVVNYTVETPKYISNTAKIEIVREKVRHMVDWLISQDYHTSFTIKSYTQVSLIIRIFKPLNAK